MPRHRDFDAARAEHQGEPLTFRLAGRDFSVPFIAALPMLDIGTTMVAGGMDVAAAFSRFLFAVIPEDQHEELQAALAEVELSDVVNLATWLIEEATNRPLPNASDSTDGPSGNGATSKLAAASIGWTPSE